MAKFASDAVLDAPLDKIIAEADRMILCAGQPASYAAATGANALADVAVVPGDFTKANGDTSGRKATIAAKNGVTVDASGTGDHVALVDDGASALLYITTAPTTEVAAAGTVDIGAWDIEFGDPA